ncbi:MAG: polymerase ECF-type sigma factor, partial [Paenibacillus sp.]|nr:polymerase ECF-type sigma factor [Paenibacillus sp.]
MSLITSSEYNNRISKVGLCPVQLQETLSRYCLSIAGTSWEAEDLAQESWLKALGTLMGKGHSNPEAFLLRIAKNTWIDHVRRKAYITGILQQYMPKVEPPVEGSFGIEIAFQALINHLSPLQRAVFLL